MSGYGVMLGLCGFMLLVLSILAFRAMLEIFLVFFVACRNLVAHLAAKADTVINKWQGTRPPIKLLWRNTLSFLN